MAKILIVDDSRTSRKILRNLLEDAGHTIVGEATNGMEGVSQYKELKPDITTMDITMPELDGIESLKLIKEADKDAIIVMISAAGQKNKMIEAVKYGASEFIAKPFVAEEITDVIEKISK